MENQDFIINDGILKKYNGKDTEVVIPDGVKKIDSIAFARCHHIESVVIPSGVEEIGLHAFLGCISLKNIIIPEGVKKIEWGAFQKCLSLTNVSIPNSLEIIEKEVFAECPMLVYNEIDGVKYLGNEENPYIILVSSTNKNIEEVEIKDTTIAILEDAFEGCKNLKEVTIPDKVYSIGSSAFNECYSLEKLTLSSNLVYIDAYAFNECNLKELYLTDNVKNIIFDAFSYNRELKEIRIPNCLEKLGDDVFKGCNKIKYNEFNNGLYLGNEENPYLILFNVQDYDVEEFEINENTKIIAYNAFENCTNLKNIVIPNNVIQIGNNAFNNCTSLQSVVLSNNLNRIEESAFSNCESLENVTFPHNYVLIDDYAFSNCTSLKEITINCGLIGDYAFEGCESLTTVTLDKSVLMYEDSFVDCENVEFKYI